MRRIRCKSGLEGWTCRLQKNYENDYKSFQDYCEIYNIHGRLGYRTPKEAWEANPIMRGSTIPSDLQRKDKNGKWVEIPELA